MIERTEVVRAKNCQNLSRVVERYKKFNDDGSWDYSKHLKVTKVKVVLIRNQRKVFLHLPRIAAESSVLN